MNKIINKNWLAVMNAARQLKFGCRETNQFYACPMSGFDSLIQFNSKYPVVRKLLAEGLKLNHPLQRFALHLNNQDQHWMHPPNPEGNEFCPNHTFQVKENMFLLTATLLLAGKIGSNENVTYSTAGVVTDMVTFEKQESRQAHLAQAAQMLYLSQRIHQTVRNNYDEESDELNVSTKKENDKGNKIASLVGDLFITEMFNLLSKVENNQVFKFMSETLGQFSQENFALQQSENLSPSVSMRLDHGNKGEWKKKELTLFHKGFITSPMALELLFGNSFYCTAILNGHNNEDKLQLLGSHFGKMYSSHKRVLYLIEYLFLYSGKAQTTMGKSATNALKSEEILETLRLELDKLRISKEAIVNAFNLMHISSDVRFALGSITDYFSYQGVNFNDEPDKFLLELF